MVVVIPVRFKEKELKKIDELVKSGVYKNRMEAIRSLSLEAAMSRHTDLTSSRMNEAAEAILDALRQDRSSLSITAPRKAAEIVSEGRDKL